MLLETNVCFSKYSVNQKSSFWAWRQLTPTEAKPSIPVTQCHTAWACSSRPWSELPRPLLEALQFQKQFSGYPAATFKRCLSHVKSKLRNPPVLQGTFWHGTWLLTERSLWWSWYIHRIDVLHQHTKLSCDWVVWVQRALQMGTCTLTCSIKPQALDPLLKCNHCLLLPSIART